MKEGSCGKTYYKRKQTLRVIKWMVYLHFYIATAQLVDNLLSEQEQKQVSQHSLLNKHGPLQQERDKSTTKQLGPFSSDNSYSHSHMGEGIPFHLENIMLSTWHWKKEHEFPNFTPPVASYES